MNSEKYIKQLQQCATEEGLIRLRTLMLEFAAPLAQLSSLKVELEAMMVEQPGIDYDRLADKVQGPLERAATLLAKIEILSAEVKNEPEILELLVNIGQSMTLRTISVWEGELESCKKAIELRRVAEQRAAEERACRQREEEAERQRAAEERACRQREEEAERQRLAKKEWQREQLERWLDMVAIPGGRFEMGDLFGDGYSDEGPVHEVELDSFYLCRYPVTQGLWLAVMGEDPSELIVESYPLVCVSWDDVQAFLEKLNKLTGRKYRLPTEAEWEYAARSGGKKEKWPGTSAENELQYYAWYSANAGDSTHLVGEKKPNGLGLHDMGGNVWEWCSDLYNEKYYSQFAGWRWWTKPENLKNPPGADTGLERVCRGGGHNDSPVSLRSAFRGHLTPDSRGFALGFRLSLPGQ